MNVSRTGPDANEQVLIYQSMLGAWPIDPDRMKQYMTKALREGKTHTNWIEINRSYEARVLSFIDRLYTNNAFLRDFIRLQEKLAYFGALSSLSQVILKIASPGVPDFYRGTDLWDLSLADPDNRRPVNFSGRVEVLRRLKETADPAKFLKHWRDGRIKMYVTWKGLQLRRSHADLFREGEYIPLGVTGARSDHVVAFARRYHDQWCIVTVPRLVARLTRSGTPPLGEKAWRDTLIQLPPDAPSSWTNVLTGEAISSPLLACKLFSTLPFALLTN
jgi:(1->4)-alpha-D-glucan 1-alpha-D-glucosylmutase